MLDAEHAAAVVDHRRRLRKPLTAYAARMLAAKLGQCPYPNAAADAMIVNGWQGFEPEWLENRRGGRGQDARQTVGDYSIQQLLLGSNAGDDHHAIEHR